MYKISLIYDSFLRNFQLSIFNFPFGEHININILIQKSLPKKSRGHKSFAAIIVSQRE